jgi:hypothetical protein
MKAKGHKKTNDLTLKQARLLKELPRSASVAEAGAKAGYSDRTTANRALKNLSERAPEVLERLGLTIEHVANNCLRPLLEAKETKFFANQGIVMETRDVEALDIRLRTIDVWAKLMGAYTAQKMHLSGDLNLDLHASDEELDEAISNFPGPTEQGGETRAPRKT